MTIRENLVFVFTLDRNFRLYSRSQMILIERSVIEECRKGDFRNFRKVVTVASPVAFSLALRMTGDEEAASDIAQETEWLSMDEKQFNSLFADGPIGRLKFPTFLSNIKRVLHQED